MESNSVVTSQIQYTFEIQLIKLYSFGFVNKTFNSNCLFLHTTNSSSLLHRKLSWTTNNKTRCEINCNQKLRLVNKNRSKSTRLDEKFGSQCSHQLCLKGSSKIHNRRQMYLRTYILTKQILKDLQTIGPSNHRPPGCIAHLSSNYSYYSSRWVGDSLWAQWTI
jgi:hypothetical protein